MTVTTRPSVTSALTRPRKRPRGSALVQQLTVVLVDCVIVTIAAVLALWGRGRLPFFHEARDLTTYVTPLYLGIVVVWVVTLALAGSYKEKNRGTGTREYGNVVNASMLVMGLAGALLYLAGYPLSRGYFLLLFLIGIPLLVLGRMALRRLLHIARRHGELATPVLIAGDPHRIDEVAAVLNRERWLGYRVAGGLTTEDVAETSSGVPVVGTPDDAPDAIATTSAEAVIFAVGSFDHSGDFRRMAWALEENNARMIVVPGLTDISAERLQMRPVAGLPLVYVERPQALQASRWLKRLFDIVGSSLLLLVASPVMLAVALAIKLEDRGPVIFRQERAGLYGEPFKCLKFRSMCVDAEARLAALRAQNESDGLLFKMAKDPRITKVGGFIRRFSLDELPQFLNVFRGEMSLVGPRPALMSEVEQYTDDVRRRLHVRPGITGLWQVSGRSNLPWEDTVRLDLYYVDNWSMLQDLSILGKTVGAVVGSNGAY